MKKERIVSLFLVLVLLFSLTPAAYAKERFEVDAKAALLIDVGTGETLFEQNAHEHNYPASITKVMTALLFAGCGAARPLFIVEKPAEGIRPGNRNGRDSALDCR